MPEIDEEAEAMVAPLKALANPRRLHLLRFLTTPHYIEEIASELKMARQTAQKHVNQLVETGLVQKVPGRREHGPVTDYVLVPQRLFVVHADLGRLAGLEVERIEDDTRAVTAVLGTGVAAIADSSHVPQVVIVHGMRIGQVTHLVGEGPWLIGRDPQADLCLDYDPFISTRHAEIRRTPGGFELADLYSSNGSLVDWAGVERGASLSLRSGSIIRCGKSLVVFRTP